MALQLTTDHEQYQLIKKLAKPHMNYSYTSLNHMETLCTGQADNLKVEEYHENGIKINVWLSRCDINDGEFCNNPVTIEVSDSIGEYYEVARYEPRNPRRVRRYN